MARCCWMRLQLVVVSDTWMIQEKRRLSRWNNAVRARIFVYMSVYTPFSSTRRRKRWGNKLAVLYYYGLSLRKSGWKKEKRIALALTWLELIKDDEKGMNQKRRGKSAMRTVWKSSCVCELFEMGMSTTPADQKLSARLRNMCDDSVCTWSCRGYRLR